MTTTAIVLQILFILCLTSSVVTRSVGLVSADDKPAKKALDTPYVWYQPRRNGDFGL